MWGAERGDAVRFVLDFQCLFLNGRAEQDAPHQEPVERHTQRDGDLGVGRAGDAI